MSWRDKIAKAALDNWFGKSVATTPQGIPQIVYRGEHGVRPEGQTFQSRLGSLSFGDLDTANTYARFPNNRVLDKVAEAPRITPGYLKIEKPIVSAPDDPFVDIAHLARQLGKDEAPRLARKYANDIYHTNNWEENFAHRYDSIDELLKARPKAVDELYLDAYKYLDDPAEMALARRRGFDGAVLGGTGENALVPEYRIFDPKQFRSAIPRIYAVPPAATMGAIAAQDQYGAQP
jgi:hypothetical protein